MNSLQSQALPKYYDVGSLVRVITPGTAARTTHLVTGLLLKEAGLHYQLDGGPLVPHLYVEWVAHPTPLLLAKAQRLVLENAPKPRVWRDRQPS